MEKENIGVCVTPMTAPLTPQITCRFWQAPYSLRPQVGSIGVHVSPHRRRAAPQYDSDVEDDLQYGLRNKYAWLWRPLEETGGSPDIPDDLDPSDPILDFLGDHDLSDADDADDSLETKELPG